MTRYVVIGAGAVGALLAAQLHGAGVPSVLVARGANLRAIRENGLRIRRPDSIDLVRVPVAAGPGVLSLRPDDVLVLATKTQDAEAALAEWAWQPVVDSAGSAVGVAADLPLLTLQNGLAVEPAALRRFGTVYAGSIWIAASYLTAGEVVSPGYPVIGLIWLGRYPNGRDERQDAIAADLESAGYLVKSVSDIQRWKAHKLLGNASNGLDLFTGDPSAIDEARRAVVAETKAVYAAAGISVGDPQAEAGVNFGVLDFREVPGHTSGLRSTWQSFARGASSEVDYLNGEIVLLGRLHGVPTPVNERLQQLLGAHATSGAGTAAIPIDELFETAGAGR